MKEKGAVLVAVKKWTDPTVNASAMQTMIDNQNIFAIYMFGGLARHHTMTADGLALVVCHEIGHHIGGAPKKLDYQGNLRWASNEGQADYWASSKCFKRVFGEDDNQSIVEKMNVPEEVKLKCDQVYSNENESALCQRSSMAGLSLAKLFHSLRSGSGIDVKKPLFDSPTDEKVLVTFHGHPQPQCRLDTYFQGSLCDVTAAVDQADAKVGNCNRSDGHEVGLRPLCWYKPIEDLEE